MRQIAEGGFTCLEVTYSHIGSLADLREAARLGRELGLTLTTVHLPFQKLDISHPDERERELSCETLRSFVEEMASLGLGTAILHPNSYSKAVTGDELRVRTSSQKRSFSAIAEIATRAKVVVAVENMLGLEMRSGGRTSELRALVDEIDSEYFGLCVDTVHAHVNGLDAHDEIRQAGSKLRAVHASDSINRGHDHLVPRRGDILWDEVVAALADVAYRGDWTMEIYGPSRTAVEASSAEAGMKETARLIKDGFAAGTSLVRAWDDLVARAG